MNNIQVKLYDAEQILAKLKEIQKLNTFDGLKVTQGILTGCINELQDQVERSRKIRFTCMVSIDIILTSELLDKIAIISEKYEVIYNESK